jgi:hypothetical protein
MSQARIAMFETNLAIRNRFHQLLADPELRRISRAWRGETAFYLAVENLRAGNRGSGVGVFMKYGWRGQGIKKLLYCFKLFLVGGGKENVAPKKSDAASGAAGRFLT